MNKTKPAQVDSRPIVTEDVLHEVVLRRALLNLDVVAIRTSTETATYGELVARSRRVASQLVRAGARPDDFVAVSAERSIDTVVAMLGVMMSGAAYVPLDPDLPGDRMRSIVDDAGIRLVVETDGKIAGRTGTTLVSTRQCVADTDVELPQVHPYCAAYSIFTSGTTGRPKGVVVSHWSVVRSTRARFEVYLAPGAYLVLAPLTVDAAVAGLFFTLAAGGRIVLPDDEQARDPRLIADLLGDEQISHFDGLPSQYAALLRFHADALGGLRCVILGGEQLPGRVARLHAKEAGHAELFNEYGPTESAVWATSYRCIPTDGGDVVPIGRPISGTRAQMRTEDLRVAEVQQTGELYLAGDGLARGYLGSPSLTAQRFVADPDPRYPGERMYRTGDMGHIDNAGQLVFHGRVDQLVKVRGHRVEIAEVEARLLEHPDLVDVAVVLNESQLGNRLVAIVVLAEGNAVTVRELAQFVTGALPAHMVPAVWRRVSVLPVTANGKLDRRSLRVTSTEVGSALS